MAGAVISFIDETTGLPVAVTAAEPLPVDATFSGSITTGPIEVTDAAGSPVTVAPGNPMPVTTTFLPNNPAGVAVTNVAMLNTYAIGQNVGGLITISGLTPNHLYYLNGWLASVSEVAAITTPGAITIVMFNSAPATVFTDGAIPTYALADTPKIAHLSAANYNNSGIPGLSAGRLNVGGVPMVSDALGNLYAAFQVTTATATTSATFRVAWNFSKG